VLIACLQAAVIIFGSALLFGVNWGQPVGVAAVVILFALVGAGAGTFPGTLFRNEQQATGVSLLLGLGLGAPGGCDQPASACEVHHTKHKKNGGKISTRDCVLLCTFHHQVAIRSRSTGGAGPWC
jgi:hypothetical protein